MGEEHGERRGREAAQYGRQFVRGIAANWAIGLAAGLILMLLVYAAVGRWWGAIFAAALIGVSIYGHKRIMPNLDRRIRGNDGEVAVAKTVEAMADQGWRVLHDVAVGNRGNIDHILIGPAGVLTVETKSHAGRRRASATPEAWLRQAYAQKKLLETITGLDVDCLLVFSRAYLTDKPVSRQRGVLVLPLRMLEAHLNRRRPVMTSEEVDRLYQRLAVALPA